MAFPTIQGTPVDSTDETSQATHTINLPTGRVIGERLLFLFQIENATTPTITDWSVVQVGGGASANQLWMAYKQVDGTESDTATLDAGAASELAGRRWRISGHATAVAPEVSAESGHSTATLNPPPSFTPSWSAADTLYFAIGAMSNGNRTLHTFPTGYISTGTVNTGGASGFLMGYGTRTSAAVPEDPEPGFVYDSGAAGSFGAIIAVGPDGIGGDDGRDGGHGICPGNL